MTDEEVFQGIAHDIAKEYAAKVAVAKGFDVNLLATAYAQAYKALLPQLRKELLPPDFVRNAPNRP